ncbi:MAG: ABC transporter ATPase [Lachnospiraceae bacterium]|nr:ABC transporter ATPase [Lachnospiraceae bacterium]
MDKLNTIQKRNNLNEIYSTDELGSDGAHHSYRIVTPNEIDPTAGILATIKFQKGARSETDETNGVLDADLLEIIRDRLTCFQNGPFACEETAEALRHITEALMWLNKRAEDRATRNVLGKSEK